jgi:hypothetical protein
VGVAHGFDTFSIYQIVALVAGEAEPVIAIPGLTVVADWDAEADGAEICSFSTLQALEIIPLRAEFIDAAGG